MPGTEKFYFNEKYLASTTRLHLTQYKNRVKKVGGVYFQFFELNVRFISTLKRQHLLSPDLSFLPNFTFYFLDYSSFWFYSIFVSRWIALALSFSVHSSSLLVL